MLFNTLEFWLFFLPVFIGTHILNHKHQNYILLAASYIFYAGWDWRFLGLIFLSTFIAYLSGLLASSKNEEKVRKYAVFTSVTINLAILGFFKYADFFIGSFIDLLNLPDESRDDLFLRIILPVGISFYTFQAISYTVDVYRGRIAPNKNFSDVALFVSLFPQLVAGPIERGAHLMPQISVARTINKHHLESGLYLIAWGLYKKVCIADALAHPVNAVFATQSAMGFEIYVAVFLFAIQIYCDFSGYTDIARGLARLLGFDLMLNFNLPYFSRNPSDFWRRWHISLSTWLRDYLYIPLGGNRHGGWNTYRNLMITMTLGGLWHGARYNFLLWGIYQGTLLVIYRLTSKKIDHQKDHSNWIVHWSKVLGMFQLTLFGWLLFRVETMDQLEQILISLFTQWKPLGVTVAMLLYAIPVTLPLVFMQIWQCRTNNLEVINTLSWPFKTAFFTACIAAVIFLNRSDATPFIYFQF